MNLRPRGALVLAALLAWPAAGPAADDNPFDKHGRLRVAKSGTHLEHEDGTPFFFLADTAWTGPALSTVDEWELYLADRKKKGFTAIQFNCVSPWRTAPTDLNDRTSYEVRDGKLVPHEAFFEQLDARLKAVRDAGLLAVPVLVWAHKKGDAGFDLTDEQVVTLVRFQVERYKREHCLFVLAGDARYNQTDAEKWRTIGRAVFKDHPGLLVTTHPTGKNFPWAAKEWEDQAWLTVLGYQSGHGDDDAAAKWIHSGPVAEYGKRKTFTRPVINLEPPYEDHNGYQSKKPHSAYSVRRAVYQSLLAAPVAGFTYGGHGVWSWHSKPGEEPTDHKGTGVAKVWKDALALPGATQMGHVRTFFESVRWADLRPGQEYVEQNTGKDDPTKFVSCAAAPKQGVYVYYFPAGAKGTILLHVVAAPGAVRWFNPRTGEWKAGGLEPPDAEDWAVVVRPAGGKGKP
ncbi:MAG: hypothetical protein C0501_14995 [Isosphaera sp.]|nr:hypothetical protein [Isosphaera sp.]